MHAPSVEAEATPKRSHRAPRRRTETTNIRCSVEWKARAALKAPKKPSADFLEGIEKGINAMVGLTRATNEALKKGVPGHLM